MAESITAEAWVLVDSNGDYAVGASESDAREAYERDIQELSECDGFRLVRLSALIPLPAVATVSVTVPPLAEPMVQS